VNDLLFALISQEPAAAAPAGCAGGGNPLFMMVAVKAISAAEERELTVEIADKVRVRVLRSRIADVYVNAPDADEKAK
jgi:hypothetical protein